MATLNGTAADNTLTGGDEADRVVGNAGNDSLGGGGGADTIFGDDTGTALNGADTIDGGADNDRLIGSAGNDLILGGDGDDTVFGDDTGAAAIGADTIQGGAGNDSLSGGLGNDRLSGGGGNNTLLGGNGDDWLDGEDGVASMDGGNNNDTLVNASGAATMLGNNGDDLIRPSAAASERIDGGTGADTLDFSGHGETSAVSVNLFANTLGGPGADGDTLTGTQSAGNSSIEVVIGSAGADTLIGDLDANLLAGGLGGDSIEGGSGNDTLLGGDGADILAAGGGADSVEGGDGDDTITGGLGNDTLFGGEGEDRFVFAGVQGAYTISEGSDTLGGYVDVVGADGTDRVYGGEELAFDDRVEAICFVTGTGILTPAGEVPVECLRPGDLVVTADGAVLPVRWIGWQTVATRFADPATTLPVLVRAGALAEGLPSRDLLVSPGHALLVQGVLVQAGALVNGSSVLRVRPRDATFRYWHVELDGHRLVLAHGVPAESFVDTVERLGFDNGADDVARRGQAERGWIEEMDLPRAKSARQLPHALRRHLAGRAAALAAAAEAA